MPRNPTLGPIGLRLEGSPRNWRVIHSASGAFVVPCGSWTGFSYHTAREALRYLAYCGIDWSRSVDSLADDMAVRAIAHIATARGRIRDDVGED